MGRKQLNEGIDNTFVSSRTFRLKETHPLLFAVIQLIMQGAFGARERSGSGAMIHVETAKGNDKRVPFVARWTDAGQGNGKTQTLNTGSIRRPAVRELNLTGSQLVVGCMCFLGAIRLVLAVLKLWLFEP
jgi:hypothetical protein